MECNEIEIDKYKFELKPFKELVGKESSKDNCMRLAILANNKIDELKPYNEAIRLMSAGNSNYPLWINVSKVNEAVIKLEFSMRFRHLKISHNQETGHPPFKVIK